MPKGLGIAVVRTADIMKELRTLLAALLLVGAFSQGQAQTTVTPGSYGFSNGVHPTFSFIFEGTNVKYVESYWRDELKKISHGVSIKKEVVGAGAYLPAVSPDTVRILMKAEQRKDSPLLTAHVAIFTAAGYVGPDSDPKVYAAVQAFVQQHSTALRRQLAQQELTTAEKALGRARTELAGLQREKERAEQSVVKSQQKAAEALEEQQRTKTALEELAPRVEAKRNEVGAEPSEEGTKELNALQKEQTRTENSLRKAQESERAMLKKADDLSWEIKKNEEDQVRKEAEIARQETLVEALREKLAAIH